VKQRLSRGRKMLKEKISDVVEDTLRDTRPNDAFTIALLTALPAFIMPVAGAQTLATGAAAAKAATVTAKAATVTAKAVAVGTLGGLVGAVVGMSGGFFGMWKSISNAPTLNQRREALKMCSITYAFVWLFLGYQATVGLTLWGNTTMMAVATGTGWFLYIPMLILLIAWCNRRIQAIVKAEEEDNDLPVDCSLRAAKKVFYWSFPGTVIVTASVFVMTEPLPGAAFFFLGGIVLFSHYVFLRMFWRGLAISEDEVVFAETAPKYWTPPTMTVPVIDPILHARRLWWNDFGAMTGSTLGSAAVVIVSLAAKGEVIWSVSLTFILCVVISIAVTNLKTNPTLRRWIYFFELSTAGLILAIVIFLKPMIWIQLLESQTTDGSINIMWRVLAATIVFALFFMFSLVMLITGRFQDSTNRSYNGQNRSDQ